MKKQFNRAMHRLYACVLATATSFSLNAQCPGLLTNGGFENSGSAAFGSSFQGSPAEPLAQGSTVLPGFTMDYNCSTSASSTNPCKLGYWINDAANVVNNPEGNKFIWLPKHDYCARQNMTLTSGQCIQICFSAASWTEPGPQEGVNLLVEITTPNNNTSTIKAFYLPPSTSWNNMNWQDACFTYTATSSGTFKFYVSQEPSLSSTSGTSSGVALDNLCITNVVCQTCSTITNPSSAQTLCAGSQGSNLTVKTNQNAANSIRFVKFTSQQTNPVVIYNGTPIGSPVTPTGSASPYTATYAFNPNDFPNTTGSNIIYYVYAILESDMGPTCRPFKEIKVTAKSSPAVSITAPSSSICTGSSVALTASGGGTYHWGGGETTASITTTPTASTTYSVTVTGNGCSSTASQAVNVNNAPTINGVPQVTQPVCLNTFGTISIDATGSGVLEYSVNGGATWQTANTFANQSAGSYSIQVRSQNAPACVATTSTPIVINPSVCGDFTPTIEIDQPVFFSNSGPRDFLITISEVTNIPSSGQLVLKINKVNGFTYTFSPTMTIADVNGGTPVNNNYWIKTENSAFITLTLDYSQVIPAYGINLIGMTAERKAGVPPQTFLPITVTVVSGSAGDVNPLNNSYNLIIKAQ